jgi:predicted nucleotidyltransferase
MAIVNEEIQKITDTIVKTVPTEKIYLFGSYAYGTPNDDSDYDFYVVIPDGSMRPLEAIQDIYCTIRGIKRPVDILAGNEEVFERRAKAPTLERVIAEEGVILYERV